MDRDTEAQTLKTATAGVLARIEENVRRRLMGRVRDMEVLVHERDLVLRGCVHTYYAKQLAQHAVMEVSDLSILANEIEVI